MMGLFNPIHHLLFFFIIFTKISCSIQSNKSSNIDLCPETERNSLLIFKQSLQDSGNLLSSWDDEADCCEWEGVVCNNSTGHVSQLHLQSDDYWYEAGYHLGGEISPSLSNLTHLTYLDLSYNNFHGQAIPSFIGSLSSLEYLNLSCAGFAGKIPPNIGNLSNLHTLDLSSINHGYRVESDKLGWLSGLSKLEYLNLNHADLSRVGNWGEPISSLPCLLELRLSHCYIDPSHHHLMNNLSTSVTLIDLSENGISGRPFPVPQWFFRLENLVHLDLSFNSYSGRIPTVSNATKLQFLDLSMNFFLNSSIPDWVYSCKDLRVLDLSLNSIQGQISEAIGNLTSLKTLNLNKNQLTGKLSVQITNLCRLQLLDLSKNELGGDLQVSFGNMSGCFLGSLHYLDLGHNQFSGNLTEKFGEFKVLESLHLRGNSFSGTLPISLGNLPSLQILLLDDNRFTGNLPASLGQLSEMTEFNVENNKLEGIVSEAHFTNLSNLKCFFASGNRLNLSVGRNWIPPKSIMALRLGSWSLGAGSQIPSWLHTRRNIDALDLSNTGISGTPPTWFFDIHILNISNNNLQGNIPNSNNTLLFMSRNNFSGSLPPISGDVEHFDLSHNLFSGGLSEFLCDSMYRFTMMETLFLEGNRLSGELPDCWQNWPYLASLNVGNNTLHGRIPNSLGFLRNLMSLNLYGNNFSGQLPFSMSNCTGLSTMDLGRNNLDGDVPTWIGTSLTELKILILRSNKFGGEIPSDVCHLQSLQILNLSGNEISGVIPKCLHNLTAMATKRELLHGESIEHQLTYMKSTLEEEPFKESATVATKGVELEYSTILSLVTNIDLSRNHLSGGIPKELTSLVQLKSLNLSRNQLSGSIPESIGEMKQLESLDLSTNSLSGQIPNGFTLLSSLSFLNLSFNNLSGRIPQSTQLQTMEASSFEGNDLCGPPLAKNCSNGDGEKKVHGHEKGEERKGEIEWMYVFLSSGYAVGFSGVCSVLVWKKPWRDAYFGFLERIWDMLYVYFHVWMQRF